MLQQEGTKKKEKDSTGEEKLSISLIPQPRTKEPEYALDFVFVIFTLERMMLCGILGTGHFVPSFSLFLRFPKSCIQFLTHSFDHLI
jgi:hypothetical protein